MTEHYFFDLDNTLTLSRRPLKAEHAPLFDALCAKHDVIVVTGGTKEHIEAQLGPAAGRYFMLAQSGNHALDTSGAELWREQLDDAQVARALSLVSAMKAAFALDVADEDDLIDDRGAQLSYSVIGFHEAAEKKDAFDPDFSKRKAMLARFPGEIAALRDVGLEIFPAGSSGYNITLIGKDKGVNVARLAARENWNTDECLYVGDALGEGENDHSVVGVVPTRAVAGPDDTFFFIKEVLG
jgi:HAD superfamily hydrolase (TIGR01484 family)